MSVDNDKSTSGEEPPPFKELASALKRVNGVPLEPQGLRFEMAVNGGLPVQRYEFRFTATDEGALEIALRSELSQQVYPPASFQLGAQETAALFRFVDLRSILEFDARRVLFPPDSLVGRLTLSKGTVIAGCYFMPDSGQAKASGFTLPPRLQALVETVYDLASRLLGAGDVRP